MASASVGAPFAIVSRHDQTKISSTMDLERSQAERATFLSGPGIASEDTIAKKGAARSYPCSFTPFPMMASLLVRCSISC